MSQAQCERGLDGFLYTWPDLPFQVKLTRIRESSRGTSGEVEVYYVNGTGKPKTLTHQSFNLLTSKTKLAKELDARQEAPWLSMLEQVCVLTLRQLRAGEPIESLQPQPDSAPTWFVLNPMLYQNNTTVLYGPGDSLKSFLALYIGLLMRNGQCGAGLDCAPTPWNVLFLDWEMSVQDVRARVKLLQAGDPRLKDVPDYRRCYQPLADEIAELKKIVSEGEYDVLIVDSLAMAAGGQELERADSAIRFNAALRSLNCTALVIGHTPKPQEDQKERHLYGSVFFHNLCRVSWEVRREGDTIGCFQKKNNLGSKHDPLGFTLTIDQDQAMVEVGNLSDEPTLASGLPLKTQLQQALTATPGQTVKELALLLMQKTGSIKAKLHAYSTKATLPKNRLFHEIDGKWECLA